MKYHDENLKLVGYVKNVKTKPLEKIKMQIQEIELKLIKPNPFQTRKFINKDSLKLLARSILKRGLINPISVLKDGENYIIISGHRRLRAFKNLKKKTIPCIVKDRQNNNELIIDLVHENLIREDLTPIEKADSLRLLFAQIKSTKNDIEKMLSLINAVKNYNRRGEFPKFTKGNTKGLCSDDCMIVIDTLKSLGISENNAYLYLTLLKLPNYIQQEISYKRQSDEFKEGISVMIAEQLSRIKDAEYQKQVFLRIKKARLSSREVQAIANDYVKKVELGTWKGYSRMNKSTGKIKDDLEIMRKLAEKCNSLSGNLASFKVNSLIKLESTLEKAIFVSSMEGLKDELEGLRNLINEKLKEKGFVKIKDDVGNFEMWVRPQHKERKRDMRFTFPKDVAREINLPFGKKTLLKLKIVGMKTEK